MAQPAVQSISGIEVYRSAHDAHWRGVCRGPPGKYRRRLGLDRASPWRNGAYGPGVEAHRDVYRPKDTRPESDTNHRWRAAVSIGPGQSISPRPFGKPDHS